MSADIGGKALILIGPPGTKKTELFFELLQDKRLRLHSNEIVFVRHSGSNALADSVERKLLLPTHTVELSPQLAPLFDRSKCENVVVRREDCGDTECLRQEDCRLDRGSPFCYKASKEAQAMLDPYWIGGREAYAKRSSLRWIFLLRYDPASPAVVELSREDALRLLESGESPGIKKSLSSAKSQPFFNPHLLLTDPERLEKQKAFFDRLLRIVPFYLFNSGVATAEKIKEIVLK
jgi:hypothetical protein